jgi:hypothetical protein
MEPVIWSLRSNSLHRLKYEIRGVWPHTDNDVSKTLLPPMIVLTSVISNTVYVPY